MLERAHSIIKNVETGEYCRRKSMGYITHQNTDMLLVQRHQTGFQRITVSQGHANVETVKPLKERNKLTSAQTTGDYDFAVHPSPLHAPPAHESSQGTHGYTNPA